MLDRFEHFSFSILEINRCWRKLATDELSKYRLKSSHAIYLITLYKYPEGIAVPEFCEITGKDKSDASRMISILEERGLAYKKVVDGSLYRGLWALTKQGRIAAEQVSIRANRAVELAGKNLNEEERRIFYQSLDVIVSNLTTLCKDGIPE